MSDKYPNTIPGLFEKQVGRDPAAVALIEQDRAATYEQLNGKANGIAVRLIEVGVRKGDVVAVCLPRSIELVQTILGILKAGAAYLPLDITLARQRIAEVLVAAGARILVSSPDMTTPTAAAGVVGLQFDDASLMSGAEASNCGGGLEPSDICCVLFTSGTTNQARGVLLTHEAILTRFHWMWRAHPFDSSDCAVVHRSVMTIGSLWDTFGAILAGTPTVIVREDSSAGIDALWTTIGAHHVTRVSASVSLWRALVERAECDPRGTAHLRLGISAGEVLDWTLVARWKRAFANGRLLNVYGATECNTPLTYDTGQSDQAAGPVPVGQQTDGGRVFVLDDDLVPVAAGAVGELCVAGLCLAERYLGAPSASHQGFVEVPAMGRIFRTGDLGWMREDGSIQVVGRCDSRVKVRGWWVDVLEVERVLLDCPGVDRVAVTASEPVGGPVALTAHVMSARDQVYVRSWLRARIPSHMIPAQFVRYAALPMTASGKIDRRALKQIGADAAVSSTAMPGQGKCENRCLAIIKDVLQLDHIDHVSSFEDLGGHSLAAIRIVTALRQLGAEVTVEELFGADSMQAVVAQISARAAE